jgi:hypothetical protein
MEAKLVNRNPKSPGLKPNMPSSPPPEPSTPAPRTALLLPISGFRHFRRQPTRRCGDPRSTARQTQSRQQRRASSICTSPSHERSRMRYMGRRQFTRPGRGAHNSPTQHIYVESTEPRWRCLTRRTILRHGRQLGEHVYAPLLPISQKLSTLNSNASSHGKTVDVAAAKLNDFYSSGNDLRLDGPEKFCRSSKAICTTSAALRCFNNGVTNNGVYGDDSDLITDQHAQGIGRVPSASSRGGCGGLRNGGDGSNWSGAQIPVLSNTSGRFDGSNDGSSAMATAYQQAALAASVWASAGLTSD